MLPRLRPDQAKAKTSVAASRPKTSAPTGSSAIEPGKRMMIRIAPKPAPPVTPITSGEASGLASAPCRIAPATPSARADEQRLDRARQPQRLDDLLVGGRRRRLPSRMSITSESGTFTAPERQRGDDGERRARRAAPRRPGSGAPTRSVLQVGAADLADRAGDVGPGLQQRVVDRDVDLPVPRRRGAATRPGSSAGTRSGWGCRRRWRGGRR